MCADDIRSGLSPRWVSRRGEARSRQTCKSVSCQRLCHIPYAVEERLHDWAYGAALQCNNPYLPRAEDDTDMQDFERETISVEQQHRAGFCRNEPVGGDQGHALMSGIRPHSNLWRRQPTRPECLRQTRAEDAFGWQQPRLVYQFGKLDLAAPREWMLRARQNS